MAGNRSSASRVGRLTVDLIPDWIFAVGFPPHWKVDYGEYAQEEEARGWLEERTSHIPMRDVIDERYHRRVGRRPSDGEPLPRWCGVDGYGVPLTSRLLPAGAQQLPLAPRPRRATTVSYPDPRRVLDQSTDPVPPPMLTPRRRRGTPHHH